MKSAASKVMLEYRDGKIFTEQELAALFNSVGWVSGKYPQQLVKAMQGSATVFSAWDGEKLVGLINVLDDGAMAAYIHCLLVQPEYHGQGVGSTLVQMVREKYKNYLYLALVAEERKNIPFYEKLGFTAETRSTPMMIMNREFGAADNTEQ